MPDQTPWTCPTCKLTVVTPFCGRCGEEPIAPTDLTLRGLAAKMFHAMTSIDARAARSFRTLLGSPGALALAWTGGIRKPYVAPFQLFLIANVLFFAVQWVTGENVFSSTLDSHLHHQDWSELAQSLLSRRLEASRTTLAQYEPMFDRAAVLNAKSLILLMAFAFAPLLPLAFVRERRTFMTHLVFSLHLYTFLLLLFCIALLLAKASDFLGLGGLDNPMVDDVLSVLNITACAVYLYQAIRPVYGATGARRVVKAIVLALAAGAIALGYRFSLFFMTLYGT